MEVDDCIGESVGLDGEATSKWRHIFDGVLLEILRDYEGTDAKVRNGMETGMRKLFENPYETQMATLLMGNQAAIGIDDARQIIFIPRPSDMVHYAVLFKASSPEAAEKRARLLKFKLMSVFYTLHRRDGLLMDRFMHEGGLQSLIALLGEDHVVIQSEAVELILELLSPLITVQAVASDRQAHLHHQIHAALTSREFWTNVGKIVAAPAELFPRSHANCIRILAGAIGWLRPATNGPMPEEGMPLNAEDAADALQLFLDKGSAIRVEPDIRAIAEDLLYELRSAPLARHDPAKFWGSACSKELVFPAQEAVCEDAAHAWQRLRQLGNSAFKAGLLWPAESAYRIALESGGTSMSATDASQLEANRALVFIRAGHYAEAAEVAGMAYSKNPLNSKAAFRRAQALLALPANREVAKSALDAAHIASRLEPKDCKVAELLSRARQLQEQVLKLEDCGKQPQGSSRVQGKDDSSGDQLNYREVALHDMD